MSLPPPDLLQCADEPIRVPGAIQPHGWLAVFDAADGHLVAASRNWAALGGAPASLAALDIDATRLDAGESPLWLGPRTLGGRPLELTAHRTEALVFAELEPGGPAAPPHTPIYVVAQHFLPQLQHADSVDALCRLAAREMKRLTGFGRALVYRFDDEGHGEVLAEEIEAGYESYAGHRFPASDIPQQARELYVLNRIRVIPDANYEPVGLAGTDPRWQPGGLDLSQAALRSVSPVHLEYLRNMGTLASMSVSIVVRGRLWGLISCHNHAPRGLTQATRMACEHIGRLLSLQIESKEDNAEVAMRLDLRQLTLEIVAHLADSDATLQRLVDEPQSLLRLARATGAAVVLNDQVWTTGETPSREGIQQLAHWIASQEGPQLHTDRLGEAFPPAAGWSVAGVLALSISQVHRHQVIWFRPELVQTIQWAGDPRKPAQDASGRIHPRLSFASWQEQVRGRSAPWLHGEVAAALELRQALIGIVLRRAEELAEVATELGRVNKELEAFSYTVSHDLRAPMRHIAGYVDLVIDAEGRQLSERSLRYLSHVKEASAYAGQLVDALLDFSRMGRSSLKRSTVNTSTLVSEVVRETGLQEPGRAIEWDIDYPLPTLQADPFLLQVAVRNLVSNAVKYTRGREPARIAVRAVRNAEGEGLEVRDNGVGFQMKYANKLFGVFQRLHRAEEFEGTGIGLASVRRIVERHGGTVWAHGEPNQGAAFGFTLPKKEES